MKTTSIIFSRWVLLLLLASLGASSLGQLGRGYFELQTQFSGQGSVSVSSAQGNPHGSVNVFGARSYRNPSQSDSPWDETLNGKLKLFLVWKRSDLEAAPSHVYVDASWDIRASGNLIRRAKVSAPSPIDGVTPYPQYPITYNVGPVKPTTYAWPSIGYNVWAQNNKPGAEVRVPVPESGTVQVGEIDLDCLATSSGSSSGSVGGRVFVEFSCLHRNLKVSKCYDATPSKVFTMGNQGSAVQGTTRYFDFPKALFPGIKLSDVQWTGNADVPFTWIRAFDGESWQEFWQKGGRTARLEVDSLEGCTPTSPLNFTVTNTGNIATGSGVAFSTATSNTFVRLRPRVLGMQPNDVVTFATVDLKPNEDVWPVVTPQTASESRIEVSEKKLSVNPFATGSHSFWQNLVSSDSEILLHLGAGSSLPLSFNVTAAPAISLAPGFSLQIYDGKSLDLDLPIQGGVKPYVVERETLPESMRVSESGRIWGIWNENPVEDLKVKVTDACNVSTILTIPRAEQIPSGPNYYVAGLLSFPYWPEYDYNTSTQTSAPPAFSAGSHSALFGEPQPIGGEPNERFVTFANKQMVHPDVHKIMCDRVANGQHPFVATGRKGNYVWTTLWGEPSIGTVGDDWLPIQSTTYVRDNLNTKVFVSSDDVATEQSLVSRFKRNFRYATIETFDRNVIRLAKTYPVGSPSYVRQFNLLTGDKLANVAALWQRLSTLPDDTHVASYLQNPNTPDAALLRGGKSGVSTMFWFWKDAERRSAGVYLQNNIFWCDKSWASKTPGGFAGSGDALNVRITPPPKIYPKLPNETPIASKMRTLRYLADVSKNATLRGLTKLQKDHLEAAVTAWKSTPGGKKVIGWYIKKLPPMTSKAGQVARGLGRVAGGTVVIFGLVGGAVEIWQAENKWKAGAKVAGGLLAAKGTLVVAGKILATPVGQMICSTPAGAIAFFVGTAICCAVAYNVGEQAVEYIWETTYSKLSSCKGT